MDIKHVEDICRKWMKKNEKFPCDITLVKQSHVVVVDVWFEASPHRSGLTTVLMQESGMPVNLHNLFGAEEGIIVGYSYDCGLKKFGRYDVLIERYRLTEETTQENPIMIELKDIQKKLKVITDFIETIKGA